ncbi:hypothetical protein HDV06_004305 [Boothiomyces sp. JEL0866]|nr:hypothetical protein HDV06_004305 [Boothiomyces sp. JEL0866]
MQATVFWDFENVSVPNGYRGYTVVQQLKQLGLKLTNIHAIGNSNQLSASTRGELEESGVSILHVSSGKSAAADIAILVEIMKLIHFTGAPHTIVLITGDRDFSKILNLLETWQYTCILIYHGNISPVLLNSCSRLLKWTDVLYGTHQPIAGSSPTRSQNVERKLSEEQSSTPTSPAKSTLKLVNDDKKPSFSATVNGTSQRKYSEIRFAPLLRSLIGSTSLSASAVISCGFDTLQEYKEKASSLGLIMRNEITELGLKVWKKYEGVSSQLCLFRAGYYEGCRSSFGLLLDATFQIYQSNQSPIIVPRDALTNVLNSHFTEFPDAKYLNADQFLRAASSNHYITTKDNLIKINVPPMTTPSGTMLSLFDIMETYKLDTSHIGGLLNGAFMQYGFLNVKAYLDYACANNIVTTREVGKITMVYRLDIFKELTELLQKGLNPAVDDINLEMSIIAKKYGFQQVQDYICAAEEAGVIVGNSEKTESSTRDETKYSPKSKQDFQQLVSLLQNGPLSSSIIGEKLSINIKSQGYESLKQYLKDAEKLQLVVLNASDKNGNIIVQLPGHCAADIQDVFNPLVSFLQERKGKSSSSQIGEKMVKVVKRLGYTSLKLYLLEAESKGIVKLHNKSDPNGNMFVVLKKDREFSSPKFQALVTALKSVESSTSSALGPVLGYSVRKFNYKNVKEYLLDAERSGIVRLKAADHGSYIIYLNCLQHPRLEKLDSDATEINSLTSNQTETQKSEGVLENEIEDIINDELEIMKISLLESNNPEKYPVVEMSQPEYLKMDSKPDYLEMPEECRQVINLITPNIVKFTFTWELEGSQVLLKGSWDNWTGAIEMIKVGNKFVSDLYLPDASYEYKFIVDGEWRIDYTKPFKGLNNYN